MFGIRERGFFARMRYCPNPLNDNGERNIKNTPKHTYNCGGYALNIFNWYVPSLTPNEGIVCAGRHTVHEYAQQIVKDIPNTHIIQSLNELTKDEYAIAFRLANHDFHFMKRGKNGRWYSKRGSSPQIESFSEKEALHKPWFEDYDGEIVLLARPA